jgi:5-carboxymethyl-2-hydroxymuconate isomerase
MPHCLLEASDNLLDQPDWRGVLGQINQTLTATGLFEEADIKSRLVQHSVFVVGDGDPNRAFVTLNVQILGGRTDEVKTQLSEALLPVLARHFPRSFAERSMSLTVQVSELHRPSYRRQLS